MPFPNGIMPPGYPSDDGSGVNNIVPSITANAANLYVNNNPPYTIGGFLARWPQFGGAAVTTTGTVTAGSNQITGIAGMTGIGPGQMAADAAGSIPDGTTVTAVNTGASSATISAPATATTVADSLTFYPLAVPLAILQMYAALANASVLQGRYQDAWQLCMDLFLAHFATLYLMSMVPGGSPAKQVLAAGEARGLKTSLGAADVSKGVDFGTVAAGIDSWAAWHLTLYGQQFATLARFVGKGGMLAW